MEELPPEITNLHVTLGKFQFTPFPHLTGKLSGRADPESHFFSRCVGVTEMIKANTEKLRAPASPVLKASSRIFN